MSDLQIFNNDSFGAIRTIERDGNVLFCGSDVAKEYLKEEFMTE